MTAATSIKSSLSGLPRRLVQDGLLDENTAVEAKASAKKQDTPLVTYIVQNNMASARDVAIAASQEFGVPLLDLDAIEPDLEVVRVVDEKLLNKHRVLPLSRRGKRLQAGRIGDADLFQQDPGVGEPLVG